jgi:hypothetical protein
MSEHRTPEETDARDDRIKAVLDQAVKDGGSLMAAIDLNEPADVVELWIDRLYDGLRDNLTDDVEDEVDQRLRGDERLRAIVLLLTERIAAESASILWQVKQVAE